MSVGRCPVALHPVLDIRREGRAIQPPWRRQWFSAALNMRFPHVRASNPMMDEVRVDQLLRRIRDDVISKRNLEGRIARGIATAWLRGVSWRVISRKTDIPVSTARDQARPFLAGEAAPGGTTMPASGPRAHHQTPGGIREPA
jgi:hypothetical protein